jgi:hypothetical protein
LTTWPAKAAASSGRRTPSRLEPFRGFIEARLVEDAHLEATVLFRELVAAGFDRSYPTASSTAA